MSISKDDFREPPGADPRAGWCGGWGLNTPGYPIEKFTLNRDDLGVSKRR